MPKTTPPDVTPEAYTVKVFCLKLGISESFFWKCVSDGKIRVNRLSRRVLVPVKEMARLLNGGRDDQ